jgi:hypothetical protein
MPVALLELRRTLPPAQNVVGLPVTTGLCGVGLLTSKLSEVGLVQPLIVTMTV